MGMIQEILVKVTRGGKAWLWLRGMVENVREKESRTGAVRMTGNERILQRG